MFSLFWELVPHWLQLAIVWCLWGLIVTGLVDALIWVFQHI